MKPRKNDTPPPGDFILREIIARGWTQRDLAYVLGIADSAVNRLISGKVGITADTARALADAFDLEAEFFMNLQAAYDVARARTPDPGVAKKGRLQTIFPIREMIKREWLPEGDVASMEGHLLSFFKARSLDTVRDDALAFAAKKTDYKKPPPFAQIAWVFRVRQIAETTSVPPYSAKALKAAVPGMRRLLRTPEAAAEVPKILASCGVRLVLVEGLPGGKIDGVCFWLDKNKPVIGLSLRYDRIDNFWFVLLHEINHVICEDGMDEPIFDDLDGDNAGTGPELPPAERQANETASNYLVPTRQMDAYIAAKRPYFSERDLIELARKHGVHPGIVAGQIRNRTKNWKIFTKHLVKIRFALLPTATVDGWGQVAHVPSQE